LVVLLAALTSCGGRVVGPMGTDAGSSDGSGSVAGGSGPTLPGCSATIVVPVRMHLLASGNPSLDATWTPAEARDELTRAADFWATSCVVLREERIVSTNAEASGEAAFAMATSSMPVDSLRLRSALSATVPRTALLTPGWNVFVIRDFAAPTIGVFIPDPGVQSIFVAQQQINGTPLAPFILAHEFGHSFSLGHYTGSNRELNLMRDDPQGLTDRVELTGEQLSTAKAQASSGNPRSGAP
jgi:hypothetical protein